LDGLQAELMSGGKDAGEAIEVPSSETKVVEAKAEPKKAKAAKAPKAASA